MNLKSAIKDPNCYLLKGEQKGCGMFRAGLEQLFLYPLDHGYH